MLTLRDYIEYNTTFWRNGKFNSIFLSQELHPMKQIPDWIQEWISKDRLVASKFKISRQYLRQSKRIQLVSEEKDGDGQVESFHFVVHSQKYGRYNVTYDRGYYHCNCPFFKHRRICSHILGVSQRTGIWPKKGSIFSNLEDRDSD
jgi:hypothetical protein